MAGVQAKFPNMGKTGYASCLRNMAGIADSAVTG